MLSPFVTCCILYFLNKAPRAQRAKVHNYGR
jgi:hypothetical protein